MLGIRVNAGLDSRTGAALVIQDAIEEDWNIGYFMRNTKRDLLAWQDGDGFSGIRHTVHVILAHTIEHHPADMRMGS